MLPKLKVYDHRLPPLPMQNPYSKLIFGIKSLSTGFQIFAVCITTIFAEYIMANLVPNCVEKIFSLSPN